MNKYKICVYAICKNEEKFVERWVSSMKEADEIVVLDTGSTDNTVEKLKNLGVKVETKIINPWRFDIARNESIKLIPTDTDICVCTDLDEVLEKGWRKELEKVWKSDTNRCKYKYAWSINSDGSDGVVFLYDKIHSYGNYEWVYPVHEILKPIQNINENVVVNENIKLKHYPDSCKSRGQYLPLLELSHKENPLDDRINHYLGREYYFHGEYEKAIKTLLKHLALPTAVWNEERSASYRYIANSYNYLNNFEEAEKYFKLSFLECTSVREPLFELGKFYFKRKEYLNSLVAFESMLNIKNRQLTYISDPDCWGSEPYDYLSICYYYLNNKQKAIENCKKALNLNKNNERLINNLDFFINN